MTLIEIYSCFISRFLYMCVVFLQICLTVDISEAVDCYCLFDFYRLDSEKVQMEMMQSLKQDLERDSSEP